MNFMEILKAKLEAKGMPVVEQLAEQVYEAVKETSLEVAAASSNALVKSLVPLAIASLDGVAKETLNKIDGQQG